MRTPVAPFLSLLAVALAVFPTPSSGDDGDMCRRHSCSNDMGPIHGDEVIRWDPPPGWSAPYFSSPGDATAPPPRCYEVATLFGHDIVARRCQTPHWDPSRNQWVHVPPLAWVSPYAVDEEFFPRIGLTYKYVVRTCHGSICSDWAPEGRHSSQDYIGFVGGEYACFGSENGRRCEESCYPGAPKQFPEIPDCGS